MANTELDFVQQQKNPFISPYKLTVLVVIMALTGIISVLRFSAAEEQRELIHWQNKLNLIADSRASDIADWLKLNFHELGRVADNPSLQLYITELENGKDTTGVLPSPAVPEEPAQVVFLRNLLLITAERMGFITKSPDEMNAIHANIHHLSGTGLAIIDNNGKTIVSTEGLSVLDTAIAEKIKQAPKGQASFIDMFISPSGQAQIGFILPVYKIQGDKTADQQIAKLVGIKNAEEYPFKLLQHPGVTEKTLEATLVRQEGDNALYISPIQEGKALSTRFSLATPELDSAHAIKEPGSFSIKRDSQSHQVLMTSRPINVNGSPWILLLHIERDQALAESDRWRSKMEFIMFFALLAFVASIIAAWWYGASRRAILLSAQTAHIAAHSLAQEKLLRLVTDTQAEPVFITDSNNIVRFANEKMAKKFNINSGSITGKELTSIMGPAVAKVYMEASKYALENNKPFTNTHNNMDNGSSMRIILSEHIPLAHIPIAPLPFPSPGVLVVEQDITDIINERERRLGTLHKLIDTLVHMVDVRDPYAGNHSAKVALVAREIALGIGLETMLVDTAETAGKLMNIGKIIVPSEILTKNTVLAQNEIQAIRDSLQESTNILRGIDFDGPVVDTLEQASEHYDGTGPLKLKGDDILITARIIAVANSFTGMISPRSYRKAISIEKATTLLLEKIGSQFDRKIVIALINFVENKQGRQMLSSIIKQK